MLDALDVRLLSALRRAPRAGYLELGRLAGVSRATAQSRLERLEARGVVTGHGPDVDLAAAGYPVLAFVRLEIAQGGLELVAAGLADVPEVLEAHGTTGDSDVEARVAAASNDALQEVLVRISSLPGVVRSTSVVALSQLVAPRVLPLLSAADRPEPPRRLRG